MNFVLGRMPSFTFSLFDLIALSVENNIVTQKSSIVTQWHIVACSTEAWASFQYEAAMTYSLVTETIVSSHVQDKM